MGKSHFKSHVVWFLIWDAAYLQVSGADQVIHNPPEVRTAKIASTNVLSQQQK